MSIYIVIWRWNSLEKTNVMRLLSQKKIEYQIHEYPYQENVAVEGLKVAELLNEDPATVFKTLVTKGNKQHYYVFSIPVDKELDLKLCAKAVGEKSVEMIPVKDLLSVTGYVRGGCSFIWMKKQFPTVLDESALKEDKIIFSAGKIGYQIEMNPLDIHKVLKVCFHSITRWKFFILLKFIKYKLWWKPFYLIDILYNINYNIIWK